MHLLSLELEYNDTFYIIPHFYLYLSKSIYVDIKWLNFGISIKHISTDSINCRQGITLYTPYITLHSYPDSAYRLSFEISWLNKFYRKGLFKIKGKTPLNIDNTPGIVDTYWFNQQNPENTSEIDDIMESFSNFLESIKEKLNKDNKND